MFCSRMVFGVVSAMPLLLWSCLLVVVVVCLTEDAKRDGRWDLSTVRDD
jgi:hypothetical protein